MSNTITKRVYVAGHTGMVGSAIWSLLGKFSRYELIGIPSTKLDLRKQAEVSSFLKEIKADIIIDAAARVGGILANSSYPYSFLMDNMLIQNNLIHAAVSLGVEKFIFLGSSCIYPKLAPQPLREDYLLSGPLEPTNEWYAIAKISGVKAIESVRKQFGLDYVSLMPTNLYGPFDNFDLKSAHVLPALIRKFHEAKNSPFSSSNSHRPVELWGTGSPKREFLHVNDLARAVLIAMEHKLPKSLYNVGSGMDISIKDLALKVQQIVGHQGVISWDQDKPDGTPRKWMDSSLMLQTGWKPEIDLDTGIKETYAWFVDEYK